MLTLRKYQADAIDAMRQSFRSGKKRTVLMLPTGSGKCLGKGTKLLMADGSVKPVESVVVGDRLMGPDGNGRTVLSLASGTDRLYRVSSKSGDSYIVNSVHLLSLKFTKCDHAVTLANGEKVDFTDAPVFVEAETFHNSSHTAKHVLKGWRPDAVSFEDEQVYHSIPPYILGLWLGDGKRKQPSICKPAGEVINAWAEYAESIGCRLSKNDSNGTRCPTWRLVKDGNGCSSFLDELRAKGLLDNKHIPREYLIATVEARLALLAGLLDTDGYVSNGGYDIIQKERRIADGIVFLCRSLGLSARMVPCEKGIKSSGFVGSYYRVSISGDCSAIPCQQKVVGARKQKKRVTVFGIETEYIGVGDYYGFELDGDRQFLLADWQVTHNTFIASEMIRSALARGMQRCLFVCDRIELINQTSERFAADGIDHGVIQAQHPCYAPEKPVQVCSIQTLARRKTEDYTLLVIDEAHTLHQAHIKLMEANPGSWVVGLTATPFAKGMGKHFDDLVCPVSAGYLIEQGYLSPYVAYGPPTIDVSGVKTVRGDFDPEEIAKRADQPKLVADVVQTWLRRAGGRRTICFATNIAHSKHLVREFQRYGVVAEHLDCYTGKGAEETVTRSEVIGRFRNGQTMVLCNVDIVSKGFDVPSVSCIIQARPTKSLMVHIQQVGRGLRIADGKTECLFLDHAGNHERLGFIDGDLPVFLHGGDKKFKNGGASVEREEPLPKPCPSCDFLKPAGVRKCPACGLVPELIADVETAAGDLEKLKKKARSKYSVEDKQRFLGGLNAWCRGKGWRPGRGGCFGTALRIYKEKFGCDPSSKMDWGYVCEIGEDVKGWLQHCAIRRQKSRPMTGWHEGMAR